jgi:EF hand
MCLSVRHAGLPVSDADAAKMVALLDADGNGQIDYHEFRRFCSMLPSSQIAQQDKILYCWVDSADWISGVEYRCGCHEDPIIGRCIGSKCPILHAK